MATETDTDTDFRATIGQALRVAREAKGDSVHAAAAAGLGYRVIGRLERGGNEQIELSALYLLALYYRLDLRRLLALPSGQIPKRRALGKWTPGPPLFELDASIRQEFRRQRLADPRKTRGFAAAAGVHQSWLSLWENGVLARCDLVRVRRCAATLGLGLADLLPPSSSPAREESP